MEDLLRLALTKMPLLPFSLVKHPRSPSRMIFFVDATDVVFFLPNGQAMEKWRWDVASGRVSADDYNAAWWRFKARYQGRP